jgi:hypothetical protein
LDDISEKCVFVGYSEEYKAYTFYNPITDKYVINKDVELKEENAWDGSIDKVVIEGAKFSHRDDASDDRTGWKIYSIITYTCNKKSYKTIMRSQPIKAKNTQN